MNIDEISNFFHTSLFHYKKTKFFQSTAFSIHFFYKITYNAKNMPINTRKKYFKLSKLYSLKVEKK